MDKVLDTTRYLYETAANEEERIINPEDVLLRQQMFNELQNLGYDFHYIVDLSHRNITNPNLYPVVEKYIQLFSSEYIQAQLISVVGKHNNKSCVPLIVRTFQRFSDDNVAKYFAYLDNALVNTKSKKYLSLYIDLAKDELFGCLLSQTMEFLSKWKIPEMKDIFIKRLDSDDVQTVCLALRVLHYYWDDTVALYFEKYAKWLPVSRIADIYLQHHLYGSPLRFT